MTSDVLLLSYYTCNRDVIWTMFFVLCIMLGILLTLKIVVYGSVYKSQGKCYPPAFYFGDIESIKLSKTEQFTNQEHSGHSYSLSDHPLSNYVSHLAIIPTHIVTYMEKIHKTLWTIFYEKMHIA